MGLFDRFKKKTAPSAPWPKEPEKDTSVLIVMDRVLEDVEPTINLLQNAFGSDAVSNIDRSHPRVPAFIVTVEGIEFWCSYLPMPIPQQELDVPYAAKCCLFLNDEEREAFCGGRSFWMLAQKGGGMTLEEKRRVCWTFSRLCAVLLEQEGAVGACRTSIGLLISKRNYLLQRNNMDGKTWNDPDYFPVPLWIWLFQGTHEGKPTVETWGLKEFGLPELGFFDPQSPLEDILNYLYTMCCFQITGQQLYRNMALIPLTPELEVVCKQNGDKLYFIGA